MSSLNDFSITEQQQLIQARSRRKCLGTGEIITSMISYALIALISVILWMIAPPSSFSLLGAFISMCVLIVSFQVQFETPMGWTNAVQLAFVPIMFTIPPALLPVAVIIALTCVELESVVRGRSHLNRLLRAPANAWWSVGPALVLALMDPHDHIILVIFLLAIAAQLAIDFLATAIMFRLEMSLTFRDNLRDLWVYGVDAALACTAYGAAHLAQGSCHDFASLTLFPLMGLLLMFGRERSSRLSGMLELTSTYRGVAVLMADVVEADDQYTGDHSQDVVSLALKMGAKLGLDSSRLRNLEFSALLHDVGKVAIPKEIINKPGKLTDEEWAVIRTHAAEGQRMLSKVGGFMVDVGDIVRSHHERWDGKGYPDGLVSEAIPLEARIITACDSWSAMRTDRAYRRALPVEVALEEISKNVGTQFDPAVAAALLAVVSE